jgi:hypothetical protein
MEYTKYVRNLCGFEFIASQEELCTSSDLSTRIYMTGSCLFDKQSFLIIEELPTVSLIPFTVKQDPLSPVNPFTIKQKSRDSSVGIALGYGLDDWGSRVRLPAGAGNFSLQNRVQTGSGVHSASYPRGTGGSFPEGEAARS